MKSIDATPRAAKKWTLLTDSDELMAPNWAAVAHFVDALALSADAFLVLNDFDRENNYIQAAASNTLESNHGKYVIEVRISHPKNTSEFRHWQRFTDDLARIKADIAAYYQGEQLNTADYQDITAQMQSWE